MYQPLAPLNVQCTAADADDADNDDDADDANTDDDVASLIRTECTYLWLP